jgi:2-oxoacid:acceptor oxidoreductase gamma subunit (pyruvate/2-ketoisovalerate family)
MIELTIFGRGGQGGVTLAKLIAEAYFLRGQYVQAFGVYAAERSGAPIQAFVRVDEEEITNHNQIREPDHVIVLDRTLIHPKVATCLDPEGWIILNTPEKPEVFVEMFPGRRVAVIDATDLAVVHGLGTKTVPIVNTTIFGAVAKVFGLSWADVAQSLEALKFGGANIEAARRAFDEVKTAQLAGEVAAPGAGSISRDVASIFDADVGGFPKVHTGDWATRRPQRRRLTPPCNHACPAGNDVQGFVQAVLREKYNEALGILLETSPFPGVCGRVCPAPCMDACNRGLFDEAVNVRELERYVADHGTREVWHQPWRSERVAVVGSGPAGLSAAYHLARLGYPVTVFEAGDELGGVMRTGIPPYRLPRSVLDEEVAFILDHGVEARTGHPIRRGELLDLTREFASVFVATGLQEARSLDLGVERGGSSDRIEQGIDFLDRVRNGTVMLDGERVLVLGGGNTAIDAARSARRLGARSVHIVYRRTRTEMPAIHEEIEAAQEEGIAIDELVSPVRVRKNGVSMLLTCQRMRLGEADKSGRRSPVPESSEDAFFDITCDRVILALGQGTDLSILPEGAEVRDEQTFLGLTGAPVFCGGDFASHDGTVTAAIGSGRRAAWHIHRTLTGEDLFPPAPEPVAGAEYISTHVFAHSPQRRGRSIPVLLRRRTFAEVHRGLAEGFETNPALEEASRCFSCGVCNECDTCVHYCPEGILSRDDDGYKFDYDYCKGCGVCAAQCPRGVIYMAEL